MGIESLPIQEVILVREKHTFNVVSIARANALSSAVINLHSFEVGFTSGRLYNIEYVGSH